MSTEVKVATITAVSVILAAIIAGIYTVWPEDDSTPVSAPSGKDEAAVNVTIRNVLEDNQVSEILNIEMTGNSRIEGELFVASSRTADEMDVSLAPGTYHYEITGTTKAYNELGNVQEYSVAGQGNELVVTDEENQTFDVLQRTWAGPTLVVYLEKTS